MVSLLLCLHVGGIAAMAQTSPSPDDALQSPGISGWQSYQHGDFDSVNVMNGALTLHIPLYSLPQRGRLSLSFSLVANTTVFHSTQQDLCTTTGCYDISGSSYINAPTGPSSLLRLVMDQQLSVGMDQFRYPANSNTFYNVFWIADSTGAKHQLGYDNSNTALLRATDGTGYLYVPGSTTPYSPWAGPGDGTIYTPGGIKYATGSITDPDGNSINLTDTLGRSFPFGPGTSTSSTSGCPTVAASYQPATGSATWIVPGPNGTQLTYAFCYTTVTFRTNFPCIGQSQSCKNASGALTLVQSVLLPNGTYWAFAYDAANPSDTTSIGYAQVTQVKLPTGGTISYQYSTDSASCAPPKTPNFSRSVTQRTFDPGNGSPISTWIYSSSPSGSIVTNPLGNDSVYAFTSFSGCDMHETQQQVYLGSHTTGTLLRTKATTYQSATNPQSGTFAGGITSAAVLTQSVKTTLETGQAATTSYSYDSGYYDVQPACTVTSSTTYSCTWSSPVQISLGRHTLSTIGDYPGGTGTKSVNTGYQYLSYPAYYSANLLDLVSTTTVQGGGLTAQTQYGYDENNGSPQGVFGHQTSVRRWIQPNAASVTSQKIYNAQGMVNQTIDPNGNVTKYTYDSTGAFLRQVQGPDTVANGITTHHIVNYSIDPNTGRSLTYTDENSNQTSYSYDNMRRLTTTNYPDGGQTTNCYTDSGGSICSQTAPTYAAVVAKKVTTSLTNTTTANVDGLGRLTQTQINSDPDGATFAPTTYDLMSRPSQIYNATRCNPPTANCGESSWGYVSYAYDALGRTTMLTEQDGSKVVTSYSGNCATVTDEAAKVRKSCTDALGRLTQLFEDPAGLNYETDYQYDGMNNLLRVDQKGGTTDSTKWRTRYFMYDSLSRLISSFNPESGGANYTYDSNGNLLTKTANSTSQSLVISGSERTTTYTTCVIDQRTGECKPGTTQTHTVYDTGTVTVSLNSFTKTVTYSQGSTSSTVASALASAFNADSTSPVTASATNNTLTLTARSASYPVYYAVGVSSATTNTTYFSSSSFSGQIAGFTLTADGNGLATSYVYDALNRGTQKSFNDGTPTVIYGYDGVTPAGCTPPSLTIANGIGRRTSMCDGAGAEGWSYDKMGRPSGETRTTNNVTKATGYTYNLDGSPATLTYPSGRAVTYALASSGGNTAGRHASAIDSANSINYVTSAHYTPGGAITALADGLGIASTFLFNSRLQPCWVYATTSTALPWNSTLCTSTTTAGTLLDLKYNFNFGSSDNGNVMGIANNRDNTRSHNFSYDALNRIATAQTQTAGVTIPNPNCWGLTFGYDAWGNLQQASTTGPAGCSEPLPLNVTADSSNRISGYCYDAAGNLLAQSAPPCSAVQYSYNAENQVRATAGVTYSYDGDGKRAMKSNGTIYWYGASNDVLEETDLSGSTTNSSFHEYVFFDGTRVARRDSSNNVNYYFADHLGTSRVVASASGVVLDDSDFYPFGAERPVLSTSGNHFKFTGKERDAESGLDYFGARHNASSLGRFMSADPKQIGSHLTDPQTLNRYAYTRNSPLTFVDPDGRDLEKAVQDLKTFAKSMYVKVSAGLGPEASLKVGSHELKAGVVAKASLETGTGSTIAKVSNGIEVGVSAGSENHKVGESFAVHVDTTLDEHFKVTQELKTEVTDTLGGHTTTTSNTSDQVGLGVEVPVVVPVGPVPVVFSVGGEAGFTKEGLGALADALKEFKDSVKNPPPPPTAPPPQPPPTQCTMGDPEGHCGAKVNVGSNNPH